MRKKSTSLQKLLAFAISPGAQSKSPFTLKALYNKRF
jgi:hypothetical protein